MITILDYGMGNLRSVEKAVSFLGYECRVSVRLDGATKLIIPGVGAFGAAMEQIAPLKREIQDFAGDGKPLLGICLGQQLLFDESEELGRHMGLELIPGRVKYLPKDFGLKVPHIGWSPLHYETHDGPAQGGQEGEQVYFVHSLYTDCSNPADVAATATYGIDFSAAVQRKNVWGTQFHPEKSSAVGLRILKNFLEC